MRGAKLGSELKIGTHAHGQTLQPVFFREFGQKRKMRSGRLIDWGDAHEAFEVSGISLSGLLYEICKSGRGNASLLRLFARVHLDEQVRRAPELFCSVAQCPHDLWPVDRLDHIEQGHGIFGFVTLQWPDQMKLEAFDIATFRPVVLCLLDTVLAEHALTTIKRGFYALVGLAFGHGDQLDLPR